MMDLVFATNNRHKLREVRAMLGSGIRLLDLGGIGCRDDIPETADTFEGNAALKARYIHDRFGRDCFADDSGLEVEALGGRPGVHSARYAGPGHDFGKNIDRLLGELDGVSDRRARFRTVICLILSGREYFFEGTVGGTILAARRGTGGFGYDPIFLPGGHERTFAEMSPEEKNRLSHRAEAVRRMAAFLGVRKS
jgi:XTP/dITP diphosphohydrolase